VFLASLGLEVRGIDGSKIGLAKAQALARSRGVKIRTEVADPGMFEPEANAYGSVISISAHLPSTIRNRLYPLVARSVKTSAEDRQRFIRLRLSLDWTRLMLN